MNATGRSPATLQAPSVVAAMLAAGALIAQQVAGKATRDALFLSNFSPESLPPVMMASSVAAILAVLGFSRALTVYSPARAVPFAVATSALLLLLEWRLSPLLPRATAVIVYLHMALFGATLVSSFWSLVNERFDPYAAKRVVARIGMGASLGGVSGGLLALAVSRHIQVPTMLVLMAALNALALGALVKLRGQPRPSEMAAEDRRKQLTERPLKGLRILGEAPYLRTLAVIVALTALTETLLDYALNATAAATFASGPELMFFFATFHTGVGLIALGVQTVLARRSLETLGLAGTVVLLPSAVFLGSLFGIFMPRLLSAIVARGSGAMLRNSLFRSGYELLFTPLPEEKKRATKAIVDVGFDKLGSLAGGALALLAVAAGPDTGLRLLFGLCALASLAGVALAQSLHRGYVGALEESLRSGAVRLDPAEVFDSTTLFTIAQTGLALDRQTLLREIQAQRGEGAPDAASGPAAEPPAAAWADPLIRDLIALRSGRATTIRRTLAGPEPLDTQLVPYVIPLLVRNEIYLDAVRALRRVAPRVTGQLVDALLDPDQPQTLRRRLPRVLKACTSQRAADGLRLGLGDPSFEVRQQCGVALVRITERSPSVSVPKEEIFELVRSELQRSSRQAAGAGAQTERAIEHVFNLLSLILEREPLRICHWAVKSGDTLRGTALEYLDNVLPESVREELWPLLGVRQPERPRHRPRQEVEDELLRTGSFSLPKLRSRRPPSKP